MPIEVEKKYRLTATDRDRIISALHEIGAEYKGEDHEENFIFGGGSLFDDDAVLRIRRIGERTILTYKRRLPGKSDIKTQVEEETEVADAEAMRRIILELGFRPALVYEKRRKKWTLYAAEIVIDELPFGLFMEIEGADDQIRKIEDQLDLSGTESVHETYPELTAKLGKRNGEIIEARFR